MQHRFISIVCGNCGRMQYVPVYCGDRFCPVCSVRRLARVRHRLAFLIEEGKKLGLGQFRHVTLTIQSQGQLRPMVRRLLNGFKKLRSRRVWRMSVKGGAYVVEVTSGVSGYHAHLHIITQGVFIPWRQLRDAWQQITGATGCWISHIPASACLRYLTKYLTKIEAPETDIPLISDCLSKVRLFNPFGAWHSINRAYVTPLHPCPACGRVGSYMPYWLVYGGDRWVTMDVDAVDRINKAHTAPPYASALPAPAG